MERNYGKIWAKYSDYNERNTVMISNFYNQIEDFQRNDLLLPQFDPIKGVTDFLDDKHLAWTYNYLDMLESLESTVGDDMR